MRLHRDGSVRAIFIDNAIVSIYPGRDDGLSKQSPTGGEDDESLFEAYESLEISSLDEMLLASMRADDQPSICVSSKPTARENYVGEI